MFRLVVVGLKIDGVLVEILEQRRRRARQPRLGVTHGGRPIAVHRAEIALPVDQRQAHREVLRHTHHGVVNRRVAVGMVLAHHIADDAGRFTVRAVPVVVVFLHRIENAPVHRFQPVAHVRQRPADDHAHRVIEIGALHFLFDRYRQDVERRRRLRCFGHVFRTGSWDPFARAAAGGIGRSSTGAKYTRCSGQVARHTTKYIGYRASPMNLNL